MKTIAVNGKTPYEAYYGKKPVITHLRIFNSWQSLTPIARQVSSFNTESKAYKVYDPIKKQVLINQDVVFKETDTQAAKEA